MAEPNLTSGAPQRTGADMRAAPRSTVVWRAEIEFPQGRAECIILNISSGGVAVHVSRLIGAHRPVTLRSARFGAVQGSVAWQTGNRLGIEFRSKQPQISVTGRSSSPVPAT